jgi:hypothetical protein
MANAVMSARAAALSLAITSAPPNMLPLVRSTIRAGRFSYYLYLASCTLGLLLLVSGGDVTVLWREPLSIGKNAWQLVWSLVTADFSRLAAIAQGPTDHPTAWAMLGAMFVLSLLISLYSDSRMTAHFGLFWQGQQQQLREALKDVRVAVAAQLTPEPIPPMETGPPTMPPPTDPPKS